MKRSIFPGALALATCTAALALGAFFWANAESNPAADTSASGASDAVATVVTTMPVAVTASRDVLAYGDVAPAKTQSITFARPGQLAELAVMAGQQVAKGVLLARLVGDPVAEAALVQARSASTLAEAEYKRAQDMRALQLATNSQVDTARKAAQDARSNLDAQQKLGVGGTVEVRAPFDGVVLSLSASLGDRLAAGAPVMLFGRTDKLRVNLGIEPAQRTSVHVGDTVKLAPLALSNEAAPAQWADGRVADIQDVVDPRSQLLNAQVDILPGKAAEVLVPGVRVSARIQTGTEPGWSLPRPAVLTDDRGGYAFEVVGDVAHRVAIQTVSENPDTVIVKGPLSAQTPVVSLGNYELSDGMKLAEQRQ